MSADPMPDFPRKPTPGERLTPADRPGFLGLLMLDTRFPRPLGDIGQLDTYTRAGIPVRRVTVQGASVQRIVMQSDPTWLAPFTRAAQSLVQQGARMIATSCGFLAAHQTALQRALPVPVWTSSLLQCRWLADVGIVTFDAQALTPAILQAAGVPEDTPVAGLTPGCELHRRILNNDTTLDLAQAERDVVAAALRLTAAHPGLRRLVLECTNMPPYRDAVARATGCQVFDAETLFTQAWRGDITI